MAETAPHPAGTEPCARRAPRGVQIFVAYAVLVAASSALEGIWYLDLAEPYYTRQIGALLNPEFDALVAALFYLIYGAGAYFFALRPALREGSWRLALGASAGYGFFCFCAHNLTDLADVRGYTAPIATLDIAWGTFMTTVAGALAYLAARRMA